MRTSWFVTLSLALIACDAEMVGVDAAGAPDGGDEVDGGPAATLCASDRECSDGVFCNGVERCMPGHPAGDASGCVAASGDLCVASQTCDEERARCVSDCDTDPDADGDGHRSTDCGGGDCDDANASVHPGAEDFCNLVDEDCVPSTLGSDADMDGDGFASIECCNPVDGALVCGLDCDDSRSDVRPGIADPCGNGDEDCDGAIDEDPTLTMYPDADADGYGVADGAILACTAPSGYSLLDGDCDDRMPGVYPGAPERCNGIDDNCNMVVDDVALGCECVDGSRQSCGRTEVGECSFGVQTCLGGRWGVCAGEVLPGNEVCGGGDEDCDGMVDEGDALGGSTFYEDADGDGFGNFFSPIRACSMPAGYVMDGTDCYDGSALTYPGATVGQSTPACRNGATPTNVLCPGLSCWPLCPPGSDTCWECGTRPAIPADFDFNCDGAALMALPVANCGRDFLGFCWPTVPRPAEFYGPEQCGRPVDHLGCIGEPLCLGTLTVELLLCI